MIKRVTAAFAASLLVFSVVTASFAGYAVSGDPHAQTNQLLSILPASDVIFVADGKRVFNDALPKVLAGNQKTLKEILTHLDTVQTNTGIDLRKFDSIAGGANIVKTEGGKVKVAPVIVARGTTDTAALIEAAKKAVSGKFKEETVNGKTMYVVASEDVIAFVKKNTPASANSSKHQAELAKMMDDMAFAAIDSNTIVAGFTTRVRETLQGNSKVNSELVGLLGKKPAGIANFAGKIPGGMSTLLPLDNDLLGSRIDAISAIYGSVDVANAQATVNVTAVTSTPQQAEDLKDTLDGIKNLGRTVLGVARTANNKVYSRLLGNLRLSNVGNEVNLDLVIPQADIDALVSMIKK